MHITRYVLYTHFPHRFFEIHFGLELKLRYVQLDVVYGHVAQQVRVVFGSLQEHGLQVFYSVHLVRQYDQHLVTSRLLQDSISISLCNKTTMIQTRGGECLGYLTRGGWASV